MMSEQERRMPLALIGIVLLGLLAGVYLFAVRRFGKQDPEKTVASHKVETSPEDALKYWTQDKMRKAKPVEMPNVSNVKPEKRRSRRSPRNTDSSDA